MAFGWVVLAILYLGGLFWIARWGDGHSNLARKMTSHPATYSLALAIYCSAWTYYGMVGEAVRSNWNYLPVLLGPILLYLFGHRFIYKMALVSKKQHITTVADFIASRYGKRHTIALLVTVITLLATIPYIALQLKAIGSAFLLMSGNSQSQSVVLIATGFIAVFAILFGTKHTDVTEYRRGLILAIAFESLIKLFALILVTVVGYWLWSGQTVTTPLISSGFANTDSLTSGTFWLQTLMAAAAVVCLPRQFHVSIVDNLDLKHLTTARWLFPLYLAIICLVIPIIAQLGDSLFNQSATEPDTYVLNLAMLTNNFVVKTLVFVGGLSAATAMIIVATLTLSTMLTNDVILPKLLSLRADKQSTPNYTGLILNLRRITIALLLLMAYIYQQQMTDSKSLASIGLIAFSLVIQLLPAIVLGLYWKRGHANGVYAGLMVSIFIWILWLMLPLLNGGDVHLTNQYIVYGAMLSLLTNFLSYIGFSWIAQPRLVDRVQAQAFVAPKDPSLSVTLKPNSNVSVEDLVSLLTMFLGDARSDKLLEEYQKLNGQRVQGNLRAEEDFIHFTERALGGVIGASSAKVIVDSAISGKKLNFEEVINIFDDTTQALKFNMTALLTSLENLEQGISVIDKNLNLVAWNKRYADLFDYPPGMLAVGLPVESLVRYNAERGECGVGDIESLVNRRMEHLRHGTHHRFMRQRSDGKVIEMVGNPLPGGGFVTSFNDITGHMEIQQALEEANIDLENRVQKRSEEVQAINAELRKEIQRRAKVENALVKASKLAEQANASKTRFLTLASHDVLQPLNAAKLYLSALQESKLPAKEQDILIRLNNSVNASEELMATLLDIARLDQGELHPKLTPCSLKSVLQPLLDEFAMKAEQKGLILKSRLLDIWVKTDRTYLHRIMRNLLSNAVKYTEQGKVLCSARLRGNQVLLQVWDTGIGVETDQQEKIFEDFYRIDGRQQRGLGLGLSVVARLGQQLGSEIKVRSISGRGSCFSLCLPLSEPGQYDQTRQLARFDGLKNARILVVDDQQVNLDAMEALLSKWKVNMEMANNAARALQIAEQFSPHILLIDYQLSDELNGLQLIEQLRQQAGQQLPAMLVTANKDQQLIDECKARNVHYVPKPVKPGRLRALLQSLVRTQN